MLKLRKSEVAFLIEELDRHLSSGQTCLAAWRKLKKPKEAQLTENWQRRRKRLRAKLLVFLREL